MPETAFASPEVLNEVALTILDDEGQVAVADMVAREDIFQARIVLVRAAYTSKKNGNLSPDEYVEIMGTLGVTRKEEVAMTSDISDEMRLWD
jgi:hypothetical protein